MAISASQAKRIQQSRKRFDKKKDEFLLKPVSPPKRQEIRYRNKVLGLIEKSKDAVMEAYNVSGRLTELSAVMEDLFENMEWWNEFNEDIGSQVSEMDELHSEAFYETVTTATGINVAGFVSEQGLGDLVKTMTETNVTELTDLRASTQKRIAALVNNALTGQEDKSPSLEKKIREAFNGPARNQARFIARDQTQRAVNGLNRFRQERAGIRKYKWNTSKGKRVRDSHAQMDGLEVEWETGKIIKTPLSVKRKLAGKNVKDVANGHVGQDYQCRCTASPILEI